MATTGRPGPVLIDLPKDVQQDQTEARLRRADESARLPRRRPQGAARADRPGRRGDQAREAAGDLRRRRRHRRRSQRRTARAGSQDGHPRHDDPDGPGCFPNDDPLSLDMLGMHGSVYANYAIDEADLLLAFGVRFDDRVTGKVSEFAKHGKIVHIDIDPSEINKNKEAHIPIVSDLQLRAGRVEQDRRAASPTWPSGTNGSQTGSGPSRSATITTSRASCRSTRSASCRGWSPIAMSIVSVGVGQHQMWAAQHFQVRTAAHLDVQLGAGNDGLRPAGGDGRQGGPSRQAW